MVSFALILCRLTEMVRAYKSKNERGQWSLESMKDAVTAVMNGSQLRTVSMQFNVPRNTLRRHVNSYKNGDAVSKQIGKRTTLNASQERELVEVILSMESSLFGLSLRDLQRLVFKYCNKNNIRHPFNNESQMAGEDWARLFLKRHKN